MSTSRRCVWFEYRVQSCIGWRCQQRGYHPGGWVRRTDGMNEGVSGGGLSKHGITTMHPWDKAHMTFNPSDTDLGFLSWSK